MQVFLTSLENKYFTFHEIIGIICLIFFVLGKQSLSLVTDIWKYAWGVQKEWVYQDSQAQDKEKTRLCEGRMQCFLLHSAFCVFKSGPHQHVTDVASYSICSDFSKALDLLAGSLKLLKSALSLLLCRFALQIFMSALWVALVPSQMSEALVASDGQMEWYRGYTHRRDFTVVSNLRNWAWE